MVPLPRATRCGLRAPTASCFAQPPDQHHTGTQHGRACKGRLLGWHALGEHCESLAEPDDPQPPPGCPRPPSACRPSRHAPTLACPAWVACPATRPGAVTLSKDPFLPIPRYSRLGHGFMAITSMGACSRSSALSAHIPQLFSLQTGAATPLGSGAWLGTTGCCSPELGWRYGCKVSLAFTTLQKGPTFPPWKSTSPCALNPKHSQHHLC